MTHFRHCETFEIFFLHPRPRGQIMTSAVNLYACGYCFDLIQCEKTLRQCNKIRYNLVFLKIEYSSIMY